MKYKQPNWKVQHIVFFEAEDIAFSSCLQQAKVKKLQNSLSIAIAHLAILVFLVRAGILLIK